MYATQVKTKKVAATKSWEWDAVFVQADSAHQKKVQDAQRRFRNAITR
jgi:hypothetical protein